MGKPKAVDSLSPRSLVGMSQSARKRAVRLSMVRFWCAINGCNREWLVWQGMRRSEEYLADRAKYRIGQRLRPCPGCLACLSERQIRDRIQRPHEASLWGVKSTVTPALVPQIFGDGKAWLRLETLNDRPWYYVVRIGSDVTEDTVRDLIDDIYDAIADEWGDTQNYQCDCKPRVKCCETCRPEWPALSSDSGSAWGWLDSPFGEHCDGSGVLPAKRIAGGGR